MQQNPAVQDSGIYILKVIDANGCEATSQLYLAKFGDLPDINLKLVDSLSCRNNQRRFIGQQHTEYQFNYLDWPKWIYQ
ncbi:MAG: hypothetical protein IPG21_03710 [Saprospiraceae bacterium]|nr:hypothetical protein [Candidatus Vicinibacter affinis]